MRQPWATNEWKSANTTVTNNEWTKKKQDDSEDAYFKQVRQRRICIIGALCSSALVLIVGACILVPNGIPKFPCGVPMVSTYSGVTLLFLLAAKYKSRKIKIARDELKELLKLNFQSDWNKVNTERQKHGARMSKEQYIELFHPSSTKK